LSATRRSMAMLDVAVLDVATQAAKHRSGTPGRAAPSLVPDRARVRHRLR